MVEGVVADEMSVRDDPPRELALGLDPSALDEEGGSHAAIGQRGHDRPRAGRIVSAIGMLRVEGECHPEAVAHFSTPVMTMPRMKARCATKKTTIGITIVMSVAAWMYCGSEP